jgi:hypothetical protein
MAAWPHGLAASPPILAAAPPRFLTASPPRPSSPRQVAYLAGLLLNPSTSMTDGSIEPVHITVVLLGIQGALMVYLLKISFGKLRTMVREAKATVLKERKAKEIARRNSGHLLRGRAELDDVVGHCMSLYAVAATDEAMKKMKRGDEPAARRDDDGAATWRTPGRTSVAQEAAVDALIAQYEAERPPLWGAGGRKPAPPAAGWASSLSSSQARLRFLRAVHAKANAAGP